MNFAIPFSQKFKYPKDNIEWNIKYKPRIKQLNDFIEIYQNYRINLIMDQMQFDRDFAIIKALKEKFSNTMIVCALPQFAPYLEKKFNQNSIKHYYRQAVSDWDIFNGLLNTQVTDIFISGILGFNLTNVKAKANKYDKKLRAFCNVCQSEFSETPSLKTFFIRPEDLEIYAEYIDTFEFFLDKDIKNYNTRINVLYEIYTKDKKWTGKLNEIILGYKGNEDSYLIIPLFAKKRIDCDKKCFKNIRSCTICDRISHLNQTLKEKNMILTTERQSNEQNTN